MIGFGGDDTGVGGSLPRGGSAPLEDAGTQCDGLDLDTDVNNCGECGNHCIFTGAEAKCVAGKCELGECSSARYDLNGDPQDGCEFLCDGDPEAAETCNGEDDNCNGQKDEGFDLSTDVEHCGVCDNACDLLHAGSVCENKVCTIAAQGCEAGWWDVDGLDSTGCEYPCKLTNPAGAECVAGVGDCGVEACDTLDQDCDGTINDGNPEGGLACDDYCPGQDCRGECTSGKTTCVGVDLVCVPGKGPSIELCDGLNNDCDTTGPVGAKLDLTDEDFDLTSDPRNCGVCGKSCDIFPNALGKCDASSCKIDVCDTDYGDLDPAQAGCELCPVRPVRAESCNGKDDDCNNVIDDAAAVLLTKPLTGAAAGVNSYCKQRAGSPCNNVPLTCQGTSGWVCQYGANVEHANGKVLITETKCDAVDGNCDGQADEAFLELRKECNNNELGVCLDYGRVICNPLDATKTTTSCDISVLPNPPSGAPFPNESCNGLDDNCSGTVDENTDDMEHIDTGGLDYWIDKYEASRPDATSSSVGTDETHLCGIANRLPWTNASYQEAKGACESSGKRLCTLNEMQQACDGVSANLIYPYGNQYTGNRCNGLDAPGSAPVPTGSLTQCVSPDGVFDLSGNVSEWTSTKVGETTGIPKYDIMALHGGSYLTPSNGLTCSFDLDVISTNAVLGSLGFRCCKDP